MATATTRPKSRWRGVLINGILMLAAFGLLGWTIWGNRSQIREVLDARPDWRLFVGALGVLVVALLLTFVRWFVLVRALGLPFRLRDALRLGFIGNVFNLVIPGAVGGDLIKAAFLCREQERKTQAVASMVIDRAVGLLGLFVLASIAGAVGWSGARAEVRTLILLAVGAVVAGVVGLAILFTPALYRPFLRLVAGRGKLETAFQELVAMASAYRRRLGVVAAMLALATFAHSLYVITFWMADLALYGSEAPSLARHLQLVPLVLFTTAVPLPFGALGLTEKASETMFDLIGFPGGAVAMMGYRVVMYAGGAISALVYLANARQVRALRRQAETLEADLEAGRLAAES